MYTRKAVLFMNMHYNIELKKKLCELICLNNASTIKTAKEYNVPLKTLEKWITAFNKDNHCFDPKVDVVNDFKIINNSHPDSDYDDLSPNDFKSIFPHDRRHVRHDHEYMDNPRHNRVTRHI